MKTYQPNLYFLEDPKFLSKKEEIIKDENCNIEEISGISNFIPKSNDKDQSLSFSSKVLSNNDNIIIFDKTKKMSFETDFHDIYQPNFSIIHNLIGNLYFYFILKKHSK